MGEQTRAITLREQALSAIKAWEGLYEREKKRAQQIEEENTRLRDRERQLYDALWTLNGHAMLYMGSFADNVSEQVGAGLATPPPEPPADAGTPDPHQLERPLWEIDAVARYRGDEYGVPDCIDNDGVPYQSEHLRQLLVRGDARECQTCGGNGAIRHDFSGSYLRCPDCNGGDEMARQVAACKSAQHTPARGHTLNPPLPCHVLVAPATGLNKGCLLSTLLSALETRGMTDAPRRALESGGMPYVPENIRDLPELLWSAAEAHWADITPHGNAREARDYANGYRYACRHFSRVIASRLEAALASAPAASPGLSFAQLRQANVQRCETAFHALDHWNPMEWGAACAGEAGEGINKAKKLRRVQDSEQYKKTLPTTDVTVGDVADEIADTVIYADLWAARMGVDLGAAVADKFNRTSADVQSDVKLPAPSGSE